MFLERGADIRVYVRRIYRLKERANNKTEEIDAMVKAFREELVPELTQQVKQLDVKEIWHGGWSLY